MDTAAPSARFFSKLRSLVARVETERGSLQLTASENQDENDRENAAVRTLHELHSEVRCLKKQVQSQVASQEDGSEELRSFIKACMVLKQRTTEDIERIKRHYEKYGYKPPKASQKSSEINDKAEVEIRPSLEEQLEREMTDRVIKGEEAERAAEGSSQEPETPERMPPPTGDQMRTPQLADFGLSALHLQMVLGNAELSQEVVPPPAVALSPPPFVMHMQPSQPKTPRCSLRMDEDAPTPRLEDFGITEHTMCLNNDFTMDLFRKKPPKGSQRSNTEQSSQRPAVNLSTPPPLVHHGMFSSDSMESPEAPELYTLELNLNKLQVPSLDLPDSGNCPQSPFCTNKAAATPDIPKFETPYISKLISAKKETRHRERDELAGSLNNISNPLKCTPGNGGQSSDMPQIPSSLSQKEETTPEMPSLQSYFGSSLPCVGNRSRMPEPPVPVLPTDDDQTQDWCLATPRVRMEFQAEPCTPEMPDMSSITQDIFKLVSQGNSKPPTSTSVQQNSKPGLHKLAPGKENRAQSLAQVSEREFHGLASYMKQIPITSLNQAITKINRVIEERCRESETNVDAFHMEDLRKILEVGPQAPMYILSLVELKRLENVQGFGRNATFKIVTKE